MPMAEPSADFMRVMHEMNSLVLHTFGAPSMVPHEGAGAGTRATLVGLEPVGCADPKEATEPKDPIAPKGVDAAGVGADVPNGLGDGEAAAKPELPSEREAPQPAKAVGLASAAEHPLGVAALPRSAATC